MSQCVIPKPGYMTKEDVRFLMIRSMSGPKASDHSGDYPLRRKVEKHHKNETSPDKWQIQTTEVSIESV